jgi:hypothetical protein
MKAAKHNLNSGDPCVLCFEDSREGETPWRQSQRAQPGRVLFFYFFFNFFSEHIRIGRGYMGDIKKLQNDRVVSQQQTHNKF